MRSFVLIVCLALSACAGIPAGIVPTPSTVTEQTKLDEQAAITVNLAYKAWLITVETGINAGLIKGTLATRVAVVDNQLYTALKAVDSAYAAGNASNYLIAITEFNRALSNANLVLGRR